MRSGIAFLLPVCPIYAAALRPYRWTMSIFTDEFWAPRIQ
jgi:hypothetical protein